MQSTKCRTSSLATGLSVLVACLVLCTTPGTLAQPQGGSSSTAAPAAAAGATPSQAPQGGRGSPASLPGGTTAGVPRLLDVTTCAAALPATATNAVATNTLPPGTYGCRVQGVVSNGDVQQYTFNIANMTQDAPFSMMIMVRSVNGFPSLRLSAPVGNDNNSSSGSGGVDANWILARLIYKMEASAEWFIALPPEFLSAMPGAYTLQLEGNPDDPPALFSISVSTPTAANMLADADLAFMQDLYTTCCNSSRGGFCSSALPAALQPNRTWERDLCHLAPFSCDADGHLTQLTLAGTGLDCSDAGLPDSLVNLQKLQLMDLAFNDIGGTFDRMAQLVSQLPTLSRMFIRYAGVHGPLSCGLVNSTALVTLSISGNAASGSVPDCFMSDPTIEELYMSQTNLSGPLPDTVGANSNLRVLYSIALPPSTGKLTGSIPGSLANAAGLQYLDLSRNQLSGDVPRLPDSLKLLTLVDNALDGTITNIPSSLEVLQLDGNQVGGKLPASLANATNLTILSVSDNQLGGDLAGTLGALGITDGQQVVQLDLSNNQYTGDIPVLAENVVFLNVSGNQLAGSIAGVSPGLAVLDASNNQLQGGLAAALATADSLNELYLVNNSLNGRFPDLPDGLQVLYLGRNALTSTLPALPASLGFLDAGSNQLSGALQDVPAGSSLRVINLPNNRLSGTLPTSWLTNAPNLTLMDLHNNSLTGGLNPVATGQTGGATAGQTGGRRLRQRAVTSMAPHLLQHTAVDVQALLEDEVDAAVGNDIPGGVFTDVSCRDRYCSHSKDMPTRKLLQSDFASTNPPPDAQQQAEQATGANSTGVSPGGVTIPSASDPSDPIAADNSSGPGRQPWHLPRLAYLDLSRNQFNGSTIPPVLGQLRRLMHLDLSDAGLTGTLDNYSAALANNAEKKLLVQFNASFNQLTGRIPASLAAAPILDGRSDSAVAALANTPRWLELSHNSFSGPFPTWLPIRAIAGSMGCQCQLWVNVNGPNTTLTCPSSLTGLSQDQLALLTRFEMECVRADDGRKIMLTTLADDASGSNIASGSGGSSAPSTSAAKTPSNPAGLKPGAIAGIVIGSLVGAALLAGAAVLGAKRYKRHRSGWRREDIPHGPPGLVDQALGTMPPLDHAGHDALRHPYQYSSDVPFSTIELGRTGASKVP